MDTQYKVKNTRCYVRSEMPPAQHDQCHMAAPQLHMTYRIYHILTAQQEPYRITKIKNKIFSLLGKKSGEWTISSSSSSKVLADPSFYSDAYLNFSSYLGCPSTTFFIGTIYTVAGHCAKLNASCLRKGFFTLLHKFGSSCRWSALPPSYNRFIV